MPSALKPEVHVPVPGSHTPGIWQSVAGQITGVPPPQTPAAQTLPVMQGAPSSRSIAVLRRVGNTRPNGVRARTGT